MLLRCACIAAASLTLAAPLALGQTPTPAAPVSTAAAPTTDPCASVPPAAFDVATIKPSQVGFRSSHMRGTANSITASGSIFLLLQNAYDLHDFQITGGPDWVHTATWDIVAKVDQPPADYLNLPNQARGVIQRQRTQAVLAQRFALRCHFETKELPVYNLVLAKGGSKLTTTAVDAANKGSVDNTRGENRNRLSANGVTMDTVVAILTTSLGRTVIDKTGLAGLFDFTLTYTSDPDAGSPASAPDPDSASGPTIFTAIEEQLGLKLEPSKGPVPILVIDSIDRPSEN